MLNVIEYGKDEYDFPALLVLGCFDAIHVGHRDLIKKAKLQAKINGLDLGVMLFRDGKGDTLVYSFEERLALLEEFNVKFVLVIDYNEEFKATAALDFLHKVEEKVNVKAYMSGKDFRFGAGAKGKYSTLKNYAEDEDNGVWYMSVKDVMFNDEKISTTLIKKYLENGDIVSANELLGSQFCVTGEVIKGAGRGAEQLGFPTVNIAYPDYKCAIKRGVYKVKCVIGETEYFGMANYGGCPTFGDDRVALEVHIAGFNGDLYGETLTVKFLEFMRETVAFENAGELIAQLKVDFAALENEEAEEAVVTETVAEPVKEEIAVSANEYKELASGFDDVIEEQAEEVVEEQTGETVEEAVEEAVEEVVEEVVEEQPEEVVEEQTNDAVEEHIDEVVEEQTEEETVEDVVEEPVEEIVEEVIDEVVEEQTEEETVEEATEATVDEEASIEEEVVDEVVEESVEDDAEEGKEE